MPLPDPTQPADFQGGAPDADQAIRHAGYVGPPRHYQGLLPGKMRPYGVTCAGCGHQWMGYIEDGCAQCGAGKDSRQGKPEPARDVVCRACKGNKSVVVKCKQCDGTGDSPQTGDVCIDCGGAGTLTIDCRRCLATPGFDPEPQVVARNNMAADPLTPGERHYAEETIGSLSGMGQIVAEKTLPILEDDPRPAVAPRVFLLEVTTKGVPLLVEIGYTPRVKQILDQAKGSRP